MKRMTSKLANALFLPVRLFLSHEVVNKLGLRSLREERYDFVMQHCEGRLLDIGCGNNQLVHNYGHHSVGIDVYDFGGDALILQDTSHLTFADQSFQTVSFVASLNHVPNRLTVLQEVHRVLTHDGTLIVTMLNPFIGTIRHKLAWWDSDQHERGLKAGEAMGLSHQGLLSLLEKAGFTLMKRKRFILWMNNLYIFKKPGN